MQTYYLNDFKAKIPKYKIPEIMVFIDPESVDFEVRLFVPPSGVSFIAKHKGKNYVNCDAVDNQISIIADAHQLPPGEVWYEATYYLPDSDFPDGICTLVDKQPLGLELTAKNETSDTTETTLSDELPPNIEVSTFEIPSFQIYVEDASIFTPGDIVIVPLAAWDNLDGAKFLKLYIVDLPDSWTLTVIPLNASRTDGNFNFDTMGSGYPVTRIGNVGEIDALGLALAQTRTIENKK